jgi:hypothetical protein
MKKQEKTDFEENKRKLFFFLVQHSCVVASTGDNFSKTFSTMSHARHHDTHHNAFQYKGLICDT